MPHKVSSILKDLVLNHGWEARFLRGIIWDIWEDTVGPQIAINAWPQRFAERDIMLVVVSDPVWMQQLCFQRQLLLEKLNEHLPSEARIKNIRFVLGDVARVRSLWHKHSISKIDRPKREHIEFPKHVLVEANSMMEPVSDKELRRAMVDLYLKYSEMNKRS